MLADIIGALWGPLGGILGGLGAVAAALVLGRRQGRQNEAQRRAGQDAQDYRNERQAIDETDIGLGASDADRVRMLNDIADRRKRSQD